MSLPVPQGSLAACQAASARRSTSAAGRTEGQRSPRSRGRPRRAAGSRQRRRKSSAVRPARQRGSRPRPPVAPEPVSSVWVCREGWSAFLSTCLEAPMSGGVALPPRPGPPSRLPRPPSFTVALREFLATEIGSGLFLAAATVSALLWANSPWGSCSDRAAPINSGCSCSPWPSLTTSGRSWSTTVRAAVPTRCPRSVDVEAVESEGRGDGEHYAHAGQHRCRPHG